MSRLIVFEGIEGSGKTTQALKLVEYLQSRKIPAVYTKEPGGTPMGTKIRSLLLNPESEMTHFTELFLYMADRSEHVHWIRQQMAEGITVVCDRMFFSTFAYQGYGRKLSLEVIEHLNMIALQTLEPDLTYFIDVKPEVSLRRMRERGQLDRIEREPLEFHQRVYEGFYELMLKHPHVANIPGDASVDTVALLVSQVFDHWVFRAQSQPD
jgi:dTMP kinase